MGPEPARDLRGALLKATFEFIERDGPAAVSLREVARVAGVSHNAPYRHFATRDALLAEAARQGFAMLGSSLRGALDAQGEDPVVDLGIVYLTFARTRPGLFRLMFGGVLEKSAHPDMTAAAREAFAVLVEAAGRDGVSARDAALGAWSLVHGLAHLAIDGQLNEEREDDLVSGAILRRVTLAFEAMRSNRKQLEQKTER